MTRREAERLTHQQNALISLGFTREEAESLRRISMTLHRWHELECGDSNDSNAWMIERDETTDKPFMVRHHYRHGRGKDTVSCTPIPDRETGAKNRLYRIIVARNRRSKPEEAVCQYIQGDPRGAALYIIRPGDVPAGADVGAYYSRGICVY